MHHGYYGANGEQRQRNPKESQRLMIEALLAWGGINKASQILDVGCGVGGSSLYLAAKYQAQVTGITLSSQQAQRARARSSATGQAEHARFEVADALAMPFADNSFDLVWSLESGEHMADKRKFLQECVRVLQPGGTLIVATWCHREDLPPASPLEAREHHLLDKIYKLYHLPQVISLQSYSEIARQLPLHNLRLADWSKAVAPFWDDVLASALRPAVLLGIVTNGWSTLSGALAVPLMVEGYRTGLIRYGLLCGRKLGDSKATT